MSAIFEDGLRNEMPDLQTVGLCLQTVRHRSTNCPTNFSIVPTNRHYCMKTYLIQNTLNTVCRVCRKNPTVCRTVCRTVCTNMNTVCRATPAVAIDAPAWRMPQTMPAQKASRRAKERRNDICGQARREGWRVNVGDEAGQTDAAAHSSNFALPLPRQTYHALYMSSSSP